MLRYLLVATATSLQRSLNECEINHNRPYVYQTKKFGEIGPVGLYYVMISQIYQLSSIRPSENTLYTLPHKLRDYWTESHQIFKR